MFSPSTKEELQSAVDLWCEKQNEALEKYGDINTWDVSKITDMSGLFKNKINFNSDISNWNVSNVVSMMEMFEYAESFNQDISFWNVSNVTDMTCMFYGASSFDTFQEPIS